MYSVICSRKIFPWLFLGLMLLALKHSQSCYAGPRPSPPSPSCLRPGCNYVRLPVSWGIVRSGFNTLDVPLEAENSSEYWGVLYRDADDIELHTPRGKTRVVGIRSGLNPNTPYPDILALNEVEFSRILGLEFNHLMTAEQIIFIDLPIQDGTEQTLVLKTSSKFFVSLQLSIGL